MVDLYFNTLLMYYYYDVFFQDKDVMQPFLVPLIIIGGKYDLFQDNDPESKKIVCRALR